MSEFTAATAANDVIVSRECIDCDGCGAASPQKCCSRCYSYYYCSKQCQVAHWNEHKSLCKQLKESREQWERRADETPDGEEVSETAEGPCAICLEETVTNPVVMDCNHVFCFGCIGQYSCQTGGHGGSPCPLCRREIPNTIDKTLERAGLYFDRARREAEGSDESKKYAELALAEYDRLGSFFHRDEIFSDHPNGLLIKAEILGRPDAVIEAAERTLLANEKSSNNALDNEHVILANILLAGAYLELE